MSNGGTRSPLMILPSALVGAATGLRSQMGLAAVLSRTDPSALPAFVRAPWVRRLALAGAGGELIADKLPSAPSRLEPPAFTARLVLGALAAGLLATAGHARWQPAVVIGAASAGVSAKVGHDLRARIADRLPDPAVAVVEDGVAVGLAIAATAC
jgi:uncharacterized membrane protein